MKDYVKLYMMPTAKDSEVDLLLKYYPQDQRAGCPFDTGFKNIVSQLLSTECAQCASVQCAHATTRPAVQAYGRYSGRFRIPRTA